MVITITRMTMEMNDDCTDVSVLYFKHLSLFSLPSFAPLSFHIPPLPFSSFPWPILLLFSHCHVLLDFTLSPFSLHVPLVLFLLNLLPRPLQLHFLSLALPPLSVPRFANSSSSSLISLIFPLPFSPDPASMSLAILVLSNLTFPLRPQLSSFSSSSFHLLSLSPSSPLRP